MIRIQPLVAAFLDFVLQFLERSFRQDPRFASSGAAASGAGDTNDEDFFSSGGPNSRGNNQKDDDDEAARLVEAAYAFMELTPPADGSKVTQEQLKKQYKRLSLRYHPDRNGGSSESQRLMQKLNACMDIIEKDITGVTDNNSDHGDEPDGNGAEGSNAEKEDPIAAYERMRKEMQEEMEKEMERQRKMKEQYETNKEKQKKDCDQRSQKLKLETLEGREQANEKFNQQVQQQQQHRIATAKNTGTSPSSKSSKQEETSKHKMTDIDEDDHHQSETKAAAKEKMSPAPTAKPKNDIMECNTNDVVVALRMGLPDIAIPLLQEQLQEFFSESAKNMHFDGIKKTPQELRLEFLQQPLDEDDNSIFHYAVYYESYQAVKAICQVALQDVESLDAILSQTNVHGHTPLFFAELSVEDEASILPLIQSQLKLAELIKQRTKVLAAMKAAAARVVEIGQHIGLATTISTVLSVYITISSTVFHLHPAASVLCLVFIQQVGGDKRWLREIPGLKSVLALLNFCGMWIFARAAGRLALQYIMVEFLLILAPITVAGLVSSGKRRRGGGGRMVDLLLLPFHVHLFVSRHLEPVLAFLCRYITPKMLIKRGWARPYYLCLVILAAMGLKQIELDKLY